MTTTALPTLTSLRDVAERYGLPLRSLRERARRREFAHIRLGRERYLTDPQLKAFLRAHTVMPEQAAAVDQRAADMAAVAERAARARRGRRTPGVGR